MPNIQIGWTDDDEPVMGPAKWVICERCEGDGTIHGGAVGAFSPNDEFVTDDFLDDYLGGVYDIACTECNGTGKVLMADEDRMTNEEFAAWEQYQRDKWESEAADRSERAYFGYDR